jgi:histidyl-tRNA synthetase
MASLLPPGSLALEDVRLLLSQPSTWRLAEDLTEKASSSALTFTADSVFPDCFQVYDPIVRLAVLLAASSAISAGDPGAIIGLTLVNFYNALPAVAPSGAPASPFESTLFDLSASSSTDAAFADVLLAVLDGLELTPADEALLRRPYVTAATVLATAALSERLWDYIACVFGVWGELEGAAVLQTSLYTRETAPLYLSLTVQRIGDIVMDSKLLKKTGGSDFFARCSPVLAPLLGAIANVRTLIAKSANIYFEFFGLQAAISNFSTAVSFILSFIASLQGAETPVAPPLNRLTIELADQLASFFNTVVSAKLAERQAAIPAGRQLPFGLISREFLKFINPGGISALIALPVFKAPEGKKREIPKEPIGTRDLQPLQMRIRERVVDLITAVFKRHGAVTIDTPVFELREVLTEKYGEEGKLIYNLEDQGGELLSLRYDLTVPFARYVATHGESSIKRYHIAKVYRRDKPQVERGRFREFYQCDFDIAGPSGLMIADAEVLQVMAELLTAIGALCRFDFTIEVSHRRLLSLIVALAGVPPEKFRTVCSSVDKLDKLEWAEVRSELVNLRGITGEAADRLWGFIQLSGEPIATLALLRERLIAEYGAREGGRAEYERDAAKLLDEIALLFDYLAALGALEKIKFNLSLARGLDYYTGVIFEAVAHDGDSDVRVGSIAGGGRYDELIGMFSGRKVPAVGGSIGIERVFALIEERLKESVRPSDTDVFVCSVAQNLTKERLAIAAELWGAGVATEFVYKEKPDAKAQFGQAAACGAKLAVIIAPDEVASGTVKIKILAESREVTVPRSELLTTVKRILTP